MEKFCEKSLIDNIVEKRSELYKLEIEFANIAEKALAEYNTKVKKTEPVNGLAKGSISSNGQYVVYEICGKTYEIIPIEFLMEPSKYVEVHKEIV